MKIGLLTFHETTNFGSYLQTYGLYRALQMLGYDCEVIDYKCAPIISRELPRSRPKSFSPHDLGKYLLVDRKMQKKYAAFQKQINNTMNLSKPYDRSTIAEADGQYDVFLVGSDMLWNLDIVGGDRTYFLDFVKDNQKKFAYATSIGEPWKEEEIPSVCSLLADFQRICLREYTSAEWLAKLPGKDVCMRGGAVCDPTMLVERSVWEAMEGKRKKQWGDYVLTYFNTNQMVEDAKVFAGKHGCQVLAINYGLPFKGVKNISPYEIAEFLALVKYAKAVFTASYHGMLFSIYYEVPFCCYMRSNGNDVRLLDVLERLELEKCNRGKQCGTPDLDLNYRRVTAEVKKWREESLGILKSYWER